MHFNSFATDKIPIPKITIAKEHEEITRVIKAFEKERKEGKTKRYKDLAAFQKAMNG